MVRYVSSVSNSFARDLDNILFLFWLVVHNLNYNSVLIRCNTSAIHLSISNQLFDLRPSPVQICKIMRNIKRETEDNSNDCSITFTINIT